MNRLESFLELFHEAIAMHEVYIPSNGILAGRCVKQKQQHRLWEMFQYDNMHFPLGDAFLLDGIPGIIRKIEHSDDSESSEKDYMQAVKAVYQEILSYIEKHEALANVRLKEATGKEEAIRLSEIAKNCNALTKGAPKTFAQALQLFWFMYVIRNPFGYGCIGRLDQKLIPFYARGKQCEIEDGKVLELIIEFYKLLNEMGTGDTLRNLMLSGQSASGEDESSELTYLFLEAQRKLGGAEPHLNVRLHKKSPDRLINKCIELIGTGQGQPTLYFDDNIIPAMEKAGIAHDMACRYANDGCTETVIDGGSGIFFLQHEMVKTVELTLFNGKENPCVVPFEMSKSRRHSPKMTPSTGLVLGYESGDIHNVESFDKVFQAFDRQLEYQLTHWLQKINQKVKEDELYSITSPLVGGTFRQCLEKGKDPLRGGGFQVANYQILSGSVGTAADCLCGIQEAVFEQKWCTMKELVDALSCDFTGYEVLRQRLLHCAKYGNGNEKADSIACRIASRFIEIVNGYCCDNGTRVWPGLYNIDFMIEANITGATPDGRRFRDPIGEHCSPTPGMAKRGPTAIMESAAKLPMREGYASSPLHLTLDHSSFIMGADKVDILFHLISSASEMGIPVLNISMYRKEELIDAKEHPERHPDLVVRVWGFNARFVELDENLQDHIIRRLC